LPATALRDLLGARFLFSLSLVGLKYAYARKSARIAVAGLLATGG